MKDSKKSVLIGALDYMQKIDPNGIWEDASEDIAHGEIMENDDIVYMIQTLTKWQDELEDSNRMKNDMLEWIKKLNELL